MHPQEHYRVSGNEASAAIQRRPLRHRDHVPRRAHLRGAPEGAARRRIVVAAAGSRSVAAVELPEPQGRNGRGLEHGGGEAELLLLRLHADERPLLSSVRLADDDARVEVLLAVASLADERGAGV